MRFIAAIQFIRVLLWMFILISISHCAAFCSFDFVSLLQPGDPSDVLSAGLVLPGSYAFSPDTDRPLSLLVYPSSFTVEINDSHPYRQDGPDPGRLSSSEIATTLHDRRNIGSVMAAIGSHFQDESASFREDGTWTSRAGIDGNNNNIAFACGYDGLRIGFTHGNGDLNGSATSSRLAGIETLPGLGYGTIDWDEESSGNTVEAAKAFGRFEIGGQVTKGRGALSAETYSEGQGYFLYQDADGISRMQYLALKHHSTTHILMFNSSNGSTTGPVLVGRLIAGGMRGSASSHSTAYIRRKDSKDRSRMFSLEYYKTSADVYAKAGGFLIPGLFSSSYSIDGQLNLNNLTARYGSEHQRGSTAIRYSIMLVYATPNVDYYATKASWMRPLHILADEHLNGTHVIVVSPALGAGYHKGDWSLDAGISVYGALSINHNDKEKNKPQQEQSNPENKPRNKISPGFRWGLTIKRVF